MMEQYRLIGDPLGHSLSPQIHEKLFALGQRSASYDLLSFPPDQLASHLPALKALNGFSITLPYKQAIIPYLDDLADSAQLYSAVNTVQNCNARYIGHNTDCDGFLHTMSAHGISLQTHVCILGAGGVGRMFAIECARQGAQVTLAVRKSSLAKAQALAAELMQKTGVCAAIASIDDLHGSFGLVINATPSGMYPNTAFSPIPRSVVENIDAVFDCIYNPAETLLLRYARELDKQAVGGMDMLVWQAAAAHEIWYNCKFKPADVLAIIAQMNALLLKREHEA